MKMNTKYVHLCYWGFVTLIPFVISQQEPTTPTPYHPPSDPQSRGAGASTQGDPTPSGRPRSGTDNPGSDKDNTRHENVVYVAKEDYDFTENSQVSSSREDGGTETATSDQNNNRPGLPNSQQYADFGDMLGSQGAELYRLLALGPQQSDPAMGDLSRLLGRINGQSPTTQGNVDHCPDRPEIGIQYYCMQLEDGIYYDPWNPWCGFIRCHDGVAERVCCKQGTWLGIVMFKANQKDMCRRPLTSLKLEGDRCPVPNTSNLCRPAKKVEKMNPPKKKLELPLSRLSDFASQRFGPVLSTDDNKTDNSERSDVVATQ